MSRIFITFYYLTIKNNLKSLNRLQNYMFAVINLSGKQFHIKKGIKIDTDRIAHDVDTVFENKDVLAFSKDGSDLVLNPVSVSVKLKVLAHYRDHKVIIFKKKRRKGYKKKNGHRQERTLLLVEDIIS